VIQLRGTYSGVFFFGTMPRTMQPVPITLPKKRRIIRKEQQPDQRQFTVVPIRAASDRNLTPMQLRCLMILCSYANKGGVTWVGMKRVGEHLGVQVNRACVLTRQLIVKGYVRVLYKGYAGERAQTRQIIFNPDLTIEDVVAVSGEKAPYMIELEQKAIQNQQLKESKKGKTMSRKRKQNDNSSSVNVDSNLKMAVNDEARLYGERIEALKKAVGAALVDEAISRLEPKYSLADLESMLDKMLR